MQQYISEPWKQYRRPFVRDLAYTIACPSALSQWIDHQPLLNTPTVTIYNSEFWRSQFNAYRLRLSELDKTNLYQKLTRFLMNRPSPYRLGFHFEGLIHFWLIDGYEMGCHSFEALAHNVQLYRGKQTTGELDFIIRNHQSGQVEHWELAIKFFVGAPPYAFDNWVGLNSRDNLKLKMSHMQRKQFKVVWVDTDDFGQLKIDKRIAIIKGRFFKPITDTQFARPNWLAPRFPLHDWVNAKNFQKITQMGLDEKQTLSSLRKAHYIEWFTKRDFYDSCHLLRQNTSLTLNQSTQLETGLYFLKDKPIVIYDEHRDRNDDKF